MAVALPPARLSVLAADLGCSQPSRTVRTMFGRRTTLNLSHMLTQQNGERRRDIGWPNTVDVPRPQKRDFNRHFKRDHITNERDDAHVLLCGKIAESLRVHDE